MLREGLFLLILVGASKGLGDGGLALGGAIDLVRHLEGVKYEALKLDEFVGFQVCSLE